MDGLTLAGILQKEHQMPVIFLTANTDDATFQLAKAAKPYAFLAKPFKRTDLQRALELTISLMAEKTPIVTEDQKPGEGDLIALSDRIFVYDKGKMVKLSKEFNRKNNKGIIKASLFLL